MNFYNFHINDFRGATWHLDRLHRGIYRDLIDEYYSEEKPLTSDIDALAHKVACHSEAEKAALVSVLNEFFTLKNGAWHHKRIDRELKNYQQKQYVINRNVTMSNGNVTKRNALSNAERQAKLREQARVFKKFLSEKGIDFDKKIRFSDLKKMFLENGGLASNGGVTSNENVTESNAENRAITNNKYITTTTTARDLENFAMSENWQPDELQTNRWLNRSGLFSLSSDFAKDALADFIRYRMAETPDLKQSEMQWLNKFVQSACGFKAKFGHRYDAVGMRVQSKTMKNKPNQINIVPKHTNGGFQEW